MQGGLENNSRSRSPSPQNFQGFDKTAKCTSLPSVQAFVKHFAGTRSLLEHALHARQLSRKNPTDFAARRLTFDVDPVEVSLGLRDTTAGCQGGPEGD